MNIIFLITKSLLLTMFLISANTALAGIDCSKNIDDAGYDNGRASIDLERNGETYLCRVIGDKNIGFALRCNGVTGHNKGKSFCTNVPIFDAGYPDSPRTWDVVGNTNRYCRYVGNDDRWKRCSEIFLKSDYLYVGTFVDEIPVYDTNPGHCVCPDGHVGGSYTDDQGRQHLNECYTHEACSHSYEWCNTHGDGYCTGKHPKK